MPSDEYVGAYLSNSDRQRKIQVMEAIDAGNAAMDAQELEWDTKREVYSGRLEAGRNERMSANRAAVTSEGIRYASEQFDEIVGSGFYLNANDPVHQVNMVLGYLEKAPEGTFGSQMAACMNILKQYQK